MPALGTPRCRLESTVERSQALLGDPKSALTLTPSKPWPGQVEAWRHPCNLRNLRVEEGSGMPLATSLNPRPESKVSADSNHSPAQTEVPLTAASKSHCVIRWRTTAAPVLGSLQTMGRSKPAGVGLRG